MSDLLTINVHVLSAKLVLQPQREVQGCREMVAVLGPDGIDGHKRIAEPGPYGRDIVIHRLLSPFINAPNTMSLRRGHRVRSRPMLSI